MPQMAPYNWMILFLLFNMILILFISFNYYTSITPTKSIYFHTNKFHQKLFMWMW